MTRFVLFAWATHYRYPRLVTTCGMIAAGSASWRAFTCCASDTAIVAACERIATWYIRWEQPA